MSRSLGVSLSLCLIHSRFVSLSLSLSTYPHSLRSRSSYSLCSWRLSLIGSSSGALWSTTISTISAISQMLCWRNAADPIKTHLSWWDAWCWGQRCAARGSGGRVLKTDDVGKERPGGSYPWRGGCAASDSICSVLEKSVGRDNRLAMRDKVQRAKSSCNTCLCGLSVWLLWECSSSGDVGHADTSFTQTLSVSVRVVCECTAGSYSWMNKYILTLYVPCMKNEKCIYSNNTLLQVSYMTCLFVCNWYTY